MKLNQEQKQDVVIKTIAKLDKLTAERTAWQVDYDRSNKALYSLLAGCLELFYEIKGTTAENAVLDEIKSKLADRGVKVQKGTPVLTLIVRYVFNAERRRAFAYSRALRVAVNSKIEVAGFADWVSKCGGVEEVANEKGATEETLKKRAVLDHKVEEVKQLLVDQLQNPLALVAKTMLVDAADSGEYTLLLGKMQANGETKVLSVVPGATEAMIDAAIKKIAQALIDNVEKFNTEQTQQAAEKAMAEAMNDALALQAA